MRLRSRRCKVEFPAVSERNCGQRPQLVLAGEGGVHRGGGCVSGVVCFFRPSFLLNIWDQAWEVRNGFRTISHTAIPPGHLEPTERDSGFGLFGVRAWHTPRWEVGVVVVRAVISQVPGKPGVVGDIRPAPSGDLALGCGRHRGGLVFSQPPAVSR